MIKNFSYLNNKWKLNSMNSMEMNLKVFKNIKLLIFFRKHDIEGFQKIYKTH